MLSNNVLLKCGSIPTGLLTATVSSEFFKAAQPALLYLVPFTLLPLLTMAYLKVCDNNIDDCLFCYFVSFLLFIIHYLLIITSWSYIFDIYLIYGATYLLFT